MTQKLTLTFVKREEKISPRNNKPYTSMTIKAKEHGDRYISGFNEDRVVSLEKQVKELVEFINKHFTSAGTPVPTFDVPFNKNIDPIKDVNAELDAIAEEQYRKM